ncbi:MAG: prepilin-type N-terminal cleavage/methylation domain-containing protein [Gemmatimonadota bacterium]
MLKTHSFPALPGPSALKGGFTLVEVIVALVILSTAVLGLGTSATRLTASAGNAQLRALALEAAEDRIARVRLDPRYSSLDSLYSGIDQDVLGIPGIDRTTVVVRVTEPAPSNLDYKRVVVTVAGAPLLEPVSRQIVVAAP